MSIEKTVKRRTHNSKVKDGISLSNTELIIFKSICNFIQDLETEFGYLQRSLKRYARLVNKTTIAHTKPITKHIEVFREFCQSNRDAILSLNRDKLVNSNIQYSELVFIDMENIFSHSDKETANVIWQHLLTISSLVDPSGGARAVLKDKGSKTENQPKKDDTDDFLSNLMGELKDNIEPTSNPMEAFSKLGQSGVVGKIIEDFTSKAEDGSLDLGKMLGSFSKMMDNLQTSAGEDMPDQVKDLMGVARNLMSSLQNSDDSGGEVQLPNLGGLIGPMMSMLGGGSQGMPNLAGMLGGTGLTNSSSGSIEDAINAQVEKAKKEGKLPTIEEIDEESKQ
jgi:hypothetical protein